MRTAVDGVLTRTDGVVTHLVIVDNGSVERPTLDFLRRLDEREDVTITRMDDAFNYSRLINHGARAGPDTPQLLLLNNDIDIRHRRWLLQMSGWFADPAIAAVGAKLSFPDGRIQHAGVVLGMGGIAGHYALGSAEAPRLGNMHDQAREVEGVTAACMLVRTEVFEKVGGFNEDLPIDFQDVDFCLKLRHHLGATILYDPTYPMTHIQGATRGNVGASNPYTIARMRFLWGGTIARGDPHYSPHFAIEDHSMALADIPPSVEERRRRLEPRWSGPDAPAQA